MRVENIGAQKSIPDSPQRPGLSEGDVLIAEVTDIKGDRVILKNQNGGGVLTAKLLGDINVAVGDFVETVVDEASGGRYVLRVLDISRQAPFETDVPIAADMGVQSQAARAQALLGALSMLKNNPGADPKAAAFLSRHGLAGSAENMEAVSSMAKSPSPLIALLTQIIKGFGAEEKLQDSSPAFGEGAGISRPDTAKPSNGAADPIRPLGDADEAVRQDTQQTETPHVQTAPADAVQYAKTVAAHAPTENNTLQNGGPTVRGGAGAVLGNELPVETQTPPPGGAANMSAAAEAPSQTEPETQNRDAAQPDGPIAANADTMPQSGRETVSSPFVPAEQMPLSQGEKVHNPASAQPLPENAEAAAVPRAFASDADEPAQKPGTNEEAKTQRGEMARKALEMFVRLEDADRLAANIKKAVEKLPEQLKELKLLTDKADNTIKEAVGQKLDHIEKQMSLISEVKRFDCYQIPLQTSAQRQTTAELYVYRYRSGKKAVDPDNILILLGLDTQYMGRVETLVKTSGRNLSVEFNLEDMRLADEVMTEADGLKTAVRQSGYTLTGIGVKQLAARTSVLNTEERFEKEAGGSAGNLDVRI